MERVIVIGGVSGSGKSTIGEKTASAIDAKFIDGDSLHPQSNINKMSAGIPLSDEDRIPWLNSIALALLENKAVGIVVACSALKRSYRDQIRETVPDVFFVLLNGSRDLLLSRLESRSSHFMPSTLLDSQMVIYQRLSEDERGIEVDIEKPVEAVTAQVLAQII